MKKNRASKMFIWFIIILTSLALTIPFMGFLSTLFGVTPSAPNSQSQAVDLQQLIDEGKITIETSEGEEITIDTEDDSEAVETEKTDGENTEEAPVETTEEDATTEEVSVNENN